MRAPHPASPRQCRLTHSTLPQAPSDDTVLSAASSTSTSTSTSASAAIVSGGQQQQRGGDDDAAADVFAANAQTLCDMGFTDRAKNVQALQRTGGNIELALADIMGDEGGNGAAESLASPVLPSVSQSATTTTAAAAISASSSSSSNINSSNSTMSPDPYSYDSGLGQTQNNYMPPSYTASAATAAAPPPSAIQNIPPSQRHRNANPTQLHRWEVQFESPTQSGSAEVQTNCATWDKMKLNARTRMPRDFAKQLGCRPADVVVTVIRKIEGTDG